AQSQGRGFADPARPQPAGHDRHRYLAAGQGKQISEIDAGRGADHHRRFPGNQALLRTRLQRLHHQAGELRKLRQRHSPARTVLLRHSGTASRHMNSATPTLLFIDDDAALARLVDRGLTRLRFKVGHAASGAHGLDRLQQGGIDVIALDQYMPGLDGLETRERIPALPNAPPVVFVTAAQDSSIAVTALKAGAADYLMKDTLG